MQKKKRPLHGFAFFVWVAAPPRPIEMMEYLLYFHFACAAQLPFLGHGDCVLVARAASSAVALSLCRWGSGRATALVEWRPSLGRKAPTSAECDSLCRRRSGGMTLLPRPTEIDEDRTASFSAFFIIAVFCRHTHRTAATRPPSRRLR
ncbi:putative retrotransposon hot spot (RHS) protein, partial [Trypanosoma cruzi]